jgi:hypothetical protein
MRKHRSTQFRLCKMSLLTVLARRIKLLLVMSLFALPCDSAVADTGRKPSLPPTHFPSESGVKRIGAPYVLSSADTLLGSTELVGFLSTIGICVEVDHIPQQSRAGGCNFTLSPSSSNVLPLGWGYTRALNNGRGVTEIFGRAGPKVRRVLVEYRLFGDWHRVRSMLGHAFPKDQRSLSGWFAADVPGCLGRHEVRLRALSRHHATLGTTPGLDQVAACNSGSGYKVRGSLVYGGLPPAQVHRPGLLTLGGRAFGW